MATTQQKREWWADWRCNPLKMVTVAFPGPDRDWNLPVADKAAPAFQLFASLMRRHNYLFREVSGGTYNCRYIGGTTQWSLHAYGIAIDLNPSKNQFGTSTHNYPQGFIEDVLATGLFKWLNTFDPMHWEIDVPPSEISPPSQEEPVSLPIDKDSPKEDIRLVQGRLGVADDAVWGPVTTQAVADLAVRASTGDPGGKRGERVNGRMYNRLLLEYVSRHTPAGDSSDPTARAEASRAHARLDGIRIPG
jgi:hypothetical protein